jgi:hypothetical protein
MFFQKLLKYTLKVLSISLVCVVSGRAADSTSVERHFSGNITVTQNGISLLPNMSLGKPALIMEYSLGSKTFAFEPQLRFSLDGKPWSFIFWFRKRMNWDKFGLTLGAHPSVVFRRVNTLAADGSEIETLNVQQYLVGEINPTYKVSKNTTLGFYYLTSFKWINAPVKQTQFLTLNALINNIKLGGDFRLRLFPQVYFLKMDDIQGTYATTNVMLSHKKSPIFLAAILNQKFSSTIPGKDFVWNVSLGYSFNTNWIKRD